MKALVALICLVSIAFGCAVVWGGGPSCCAQRNLLATGAIQAVNEIGPGDNVTRYSRDARDRLVKALEYSVGPCRWHGGIYRCEGVR